jgi:hypothetical protein
MLWVKNFYELNGPAEELPSHKELTPMKVHADSLPLPSPISILLMFLFQPANGTHLVTGHEAEICFWTFNPPQIWGADTEIES